LSRSPLELLLFGHSLKDLIFNEDGLGVKGNYEGRRRRSLCSFDEEDVIKSHVLHFTLHGISAILGDPKLVSRFLSEITTWRGLTVVDVPIDEEIVASELANSVGLDFDDGLQYYYAKKAGLQIVSFDRDFDKTDVKRVEPKDVLGFGFGKHL
jgi:predicted nucleic acid-binding protein